MTVYEKQLAQEMLMSAMQCAFSQLEGDDVPEERKVTLGIAMSKQMERVEKVFGYKPGSWSRGA